MSLIKIKTTSSRKTTVSVIERPDAFDVVQRNNAEASSLKEDVGNLEKWFNDQKVKLLSQDNDKNYLSEAKTQIMQKRLETENERFRKYEEPLLNQNLLNYSIFDKNLEFFLENEKNLEKMKEFARKNKTKMFTFKSDISSEKKYAPIKSLDAIKNDFKKQILNQIMVDKLIKRKKGLIANSSLDDTKAFAYASLPNFKCLQKTATLNPDTLIEVELLKEKLNEFQQKPKKNFELGIEEAQFNKITNDLKSLEELLMEKFKEISCEIGKKKKTGEDFRHLHSHLAVTIKRLYEEKEILLGKFNSIEQRILNTMSEIKNEANGKGKPKGNAVSDFVKLEVKFGLGLQRSELFLEVQRRKN